VCPGRSTCTPLLVSGEVIGSVLVSHPDVLEPVHERRIRESVAQAAPVLGNLRNLAIAELRAATDALTGLPNRRAVEDNLKRMVAQASRSVSPLAALMLDLDLFTQVNDTCGHAKGDEVLAAVGAALQATVRASDFTGRYGGEEFIVLMPNTDQAGAIEAAEKVRTAVAGIEVNGVGRRITVSIGVAIIPDHAADAGGLERAADRALYVAKSNGRDRVEVAAVSAARTELKAAIGPYDASPPDDHPTNSTVSPLPTS
jgi:diguanylate cyclase (GGDEF)-like protein